jgi:uncharacterized integral membrane protein
VKLIHWLVTAPLALVLVVFAVSNRDEVTVTLWPAPRFEMQTQMFLVVLMALFAGFIIGGFVVWIGSLRRRREARQQARRVEMLEREMAGLRAGAAALPPAHD